MRGTEDNVLKFEFTIFTLPKTVDDIFLIWSLVLAGFFLYCVISVVVV